jgi:hypothetical protein
MLKTKTYEVSFPSHDSASAGKYASELNEFISERVVGINTKRRRVDERALDLGTVLQITIESAAISTLAAGIADWLRLRRSAKITVESNGRIVLENVSASDAKEVALEQLKGRK